MRAWLLFGLLSVAALAGCTGSDDTDDTTRGETGAGASLFGAVVEYNNPQFAPHPAYGYPTYTNYTGFTGDELPDAWRLPGNATPVPEAIRGVEHIGGVNNITGAGIAVFGHYAIVSGNGPGSIVDIADPANPVKVSDIEVSTRDADVIAYPDGRLVAVMASASAIHVFDITDPTQPVQLPDLSVASHNAAVVPGTPIVYNANSAGGAGGIVPSNPQAWIGQGNGHTEIFDLSDPENPVRLPDFENGYGCHDITFYITPEKQRAYCAGIEMTQIWDISNVTSPEVIVNVPVHSGVAGTPSQSVPLVLFSHLAMASADGDILIVGDETGGGLLQGCDVYFDAGVRTVSGPVGNLWFYDISDETNPQLLSWLSPTNHITQTPPVGEADPTAGCTAHFGRLIGDQDILAIGFYGAGVILVDFGDASHPVIISQWNPGTNVWDVWYWQGNLYTGDLNRGFDVLRLV